jgi:prepilin-type N-terminal cleavage/methylation domain-containing protein
MAHRQLYRLRDQRRGFTIVELLIATLVFSIVLLLITTGVIEMTSAFLKGVNSSNTQSAATSVVNTIAQAIQFDGGTVTPTSSYSPGQSNFFCVGDTQFSYRLGYELVGSGTLATDQTYHSLVESTLSGCSASSVPQNMSSGINGVTGRELLSPFMRLSNLSVTLKSSTGGVDVYQITVRLVYGADNLLHSPSGSTNGPTAADAACIGNTGEQFCSESQLSTIVVKRVQ